jgi:DNA helicase II / ATP-dependent DNA helicase PcrA
MATAKLKSHPFMPDERQREAINHVHGPMVVVAGAGTGKTSVLTQRIAHLIEHGHAKPGEIVALTYTVAAAKEMQQRVRGLLGKQIYCATFHDYCNGLLQRAGKNFGVLDETDLWIYLRKRLHEFRLQHYVKAANVARFLKDLIEFLSRCHDELVTPQKYTDYVARLERREVEIPRVAKSNEELRADEVIGRCREIARVFEMTERWLREENLGTFSHMITGAYDLLSNDKKVLASERARAHFILVDEFQDANFAQIKILAALAGPDANVFSVGDPDQSIYRFRGASSAAFQLFRRQFPESKLVVLGKNRRSTTPILQCAFTVIEKNPPVFGKKEDPLAYRRTPLVSAREEEASKEGKTVHALPVEAVAFTGKDSEAPDIASIIEETRRRMRCNWKDFAVIYRLHSHRDEVVRELAERQIPVSIENMDMSKTPEVRDLFACTAVVVDLTSDANLFRVAALPQFEVDPEELRTALRAIAQESRDGNFIPLANVLDSVRGGRAILECVHKVREEIPRADLKTRAALELIAKRFGLQLNSPAIQATLNFAAAWETKPTTKDKTLVEFNDYLNYFREAGGVIPLPANEDDKDSVRLMTVHGAKGLEFTHVFILRANSNSFPLGYRETLVEFPRDLRDPDSITINDDKTLHEQEERRLFYVAMTRAKDSLHIYGKQGIGRDKTPAGFMRELIVNRGLQPSLRSRSALPSQPELIEIAAAKDAAQPAPSNLPAWLGLPAIEGLGAQLSATAVETYENCPLQFKFEREWKLSRQVSAAMHYGAAMHRVLRTYYDAVKLRRPKSDDELLQLFSDDPGLAQIEDEYQRGLYLQQGLNQLRDFLAGVRTTDAPEVLHTEEWFDVEIAGTKISGRIDRMDRGADGAVRIIDYKTGKARSQEDADESLQLSIYAMAARDKWGYSVSELIFHNLEGNVQVSSKRTQFQLEQARDRVTEVAANIAAANFKPKLGYHCNFCAFCGLCPAQEKTLHDISRNAEGVKTAAGR